MLYITASQKHADTIRKKAGHRTDDLFSFTIDDKASEPIVFTKTADGKLIEWYRGIAPTLHFIEKGFVFFQRKCPFRMFGKCTANKCQMFIIENFVGECSLRWSAITSLSVKKTHGA